MTHIRKWLLAAATALVLATPFVTPAPARANPDQMTGQTRWYFVYAREDPDSPWVQVASYDNYNDAATVAGYLVDLGFEAFVR
jgi:hypothetical protein